MATTKSVGTLIPSLTDDVALDLLARVPLFYRGTLFNVSESIGTDVSSPHFFTARRLLRSTEPVLYIFIRSTEPGSIDLFYLDLPSDSQSNHIRSLTPVPPVPEAAIESAYAAVGSTIYILGGSINNIYTARVWAFDCRFNQWERAPSMQVERCSANAEAADGKIYVMGGCDVGGPNNWAEVFDTLTEAWQPVVRPVEVRQELMYRSVMMDGKIYLVATSGGAVYDARSGAWESVESDMHKGWKGRACVDGVLYCYYYPGKISGYSMEEKVWRELRGVERGLPRSFGETKIANVREKLVVVWSQENEREMEIWCTEIQVKKRDGGRELWGQILWMGKVGCVSRGSCIKECLTVVY